MNKAFQQPGHETEHAPFDNFKRRDESDNSGSTTCQEIDTFIERQMKRLSVPGAVLAIVEGDRIVHLRGFGKSRPGGQVPLPQTPFFIGSLTKSFTALAVMQLAEAGKIELDTPVQRYLPWFRVKDAGAFAQMTVRHLLNQTSGLPTSTGEFPLADFDNSPGATERQARALSNLALTRPAGAAFEYCNMNYNLLGLVIEAASGEAYPDYIQSHILDPLDMNHTYTSEVLAKQNDLAVGYRYWFGFPVPAPDMPLPWGSLPGGLIISSAEDMARYLIAHLNGGCYGNIQILSPTGVAELHRGVADFRVMGTSLGQYGMGWFDSRIGQTRLIWHSGTLPHFGAYMALLPEQKKGLVLLVNANHHWMSPVMTEFGMGVATLLAGEKLQPAPVPFMGLIPRLLRAQLLIPAFLIAWVAATLRLLRRWRLYPTQRPSGWSKWGLHILLPLISNLLVALTLKPLMSKRRGYLVLYMPDYSWVAIICGGFSLIWSFLRTGLVLRALRR